MGSGSQQDPRICPLLGMTERLEQKGSEKMKYWLTVRYGMRDSHTYTINAKGDNEFRKIAIAKYGREIIDSHNHLLGTTIQKESKKFAVKGEIIYPFIGDLHYTDKRWYWDFGKSTQFEINPATGGKMERFIPGYSVSYTTKNGKKVEKTLKYEGIEFTRFALMNYDTYSDAKRLFTIKKDGKLLGKLTLAPNGKWVWTSAANKKYYIYRENGQVSSQIR